jgi:hypothetical protein
MTASRLYCSKCRDDFAHHIARGKVRSDIFRRVAVTGRNHDGSYLCSCGQCGHKWSSRSAEAANLFAQRHAA